MKSRKAKPTEPTLVDELNKPLRDFVNDYKIHGADAWQKVRDESPAKYLELACKLLPLVAALNPGVSELADAKSMEDIGVQLLKSVGLAEDQMDGDLIAQAIAANDTFIAELEAIRDKAQGGLN
jgi:hypothetical protein